MQNLTNIFDQSGLISTQIDKKVQQIYLCPNTNNALEAWNKLLKDQKTLRNRLPLSRITFEMLTWIKEWSNINMYTSGKKLFMKEPTFHFKCIQNLNNE